jgi:hypothetical protein
MISSTGIGMDMPFFTMPSYEGNKMTTAGLGSKVVLRAGNDKQLGRVQDNVYESVSKMTKGPRERKIRRKTQC